MGLLAESKSRRKISKDPNNTKWTRDTTTFGQKILRAQGWEPGQYLGAKDAPHSELHTAANASYIRVILKDDMKGLGFSRSKEDEVTGLDVFQDLLSRLNGKSEESVQADQQARLAVKTHHYVESRWGPMRFVRGGLLVGDELREVTNEESSSDSEDQEDNEEAMEVDSAPKESKKEKKSKKRKAVDADDSSDKDSDLKSKKRRKEERKSKDTDDSDEAKARKKEKKEKKSKKDKSKKSVEASEDEAAQSDERSKKRKSKKDKSRSPEDSEEDKAKKAKKEKKEKKKRRKEEAAAAESASTLVAPSTVASAAGTGTSTPTGTGTSTPQGSRNFVRSRFIAQKRQAVLDTKALNQIFMVKA